MNKLTIGLLTILLCFGVVMADPTDADVEQGAEDKYVWTGGDTFDTEGGNVSNVNASANVSTESWAGIYGNTSDSSILLADSVGADIFYRWAWDPTEGARVCAVVGPVADWTNLGAMALGTLDTLFSITTGDTDDSAETFNESTDTFYLAGQTVANVPRSKTGPDVATDTFNTYAVEAGNEVGKSSALFCTNLSTTSDNFEGVDWNYELILATDPAIAAIETYYIYLELG